MNEPEKKRNIVACLNGLDDILFSKIVEAPAACGEILQTLAEEESAAGIGSPAIHPAQRREPQRCAGRPVQRYEKPVLQLGSAEER